MKLQDFENSWGAPDESLVAKLQFPRISLTSSAYHIHALKITIQNIVELEGYGPHFQIPNPHTQFHDQNPFSQDPQKTLESNGVFLPENMSIEFQKQNTDRPRIVVFEQKPNSKFKLRVFYLQLVMMAGR